jgi:hypothetical protein
MTTKAGAAWPERPANESTLIQMRRGVWSELLMTEHPWGELETSSANP